MDLASRQKWDEYTDVSVPDPLIIRTAADVLDEDRDPYPTPTASTTAAQPS